jgi:uncharacterized protein YjbI with pentapeptide repeats
MQNLRNRRRLLQIAAAVFARLSFASATQADIFQWEYINPADPSQGKQQSTTLAPDGAGVDALPGADISNRNLTMAYLIGADLTAIYGYSTNLTNVDAVGANLTNADLRQANLTNAYFRYATLAGADFARAKIQGANFERIYFGICIYGGCTHVDAGGIVLPQLYSTASYQAHDLSGIDFSGNDLSGAAFAGQNLVNANFAGAIGADLTGADLSAADTRGARPLDVFRLSPLTNNNLIHPDGHVDGLDLHTDNLLVIRDYDGGSRYIAAGQPIPITVDQHLTMGPGGTLRMVFEADAWDSTISFSPGIPVTLGGTLELTFATEVNLASQVGRTFHIFDWTGVNPTGAFAVSSPYTWNLSNLYITGQITLTAVPEPSALLLVSFSLAALVVVGRTRLSSV